jgi:transposase
MRNVALDLGNRITYARAEGGAIVERAVVDSLHELEPLLGKGTPAARVAIEACREAWHVHDVLVSWGHELQLVDTTRVRELGIGHHNRKNDRIDAGHLAVAVEKGIVPRAHVLSPHRRKVRELLGVRRSLTQARAAFVTEVRGICRANGAKISSCDSERFAKHARQQVRDDDVRSMVAPLLDIVEALNPRIDAADEQLAALISQEPAAKRLQTVPGVGPVVAAAFISVIDDAKRFDHAHEVESYLGLVPSEFTSGRRKLGSITKHGNSYLRALLVQAAWSLLKTRGPNPLRTWAQAVQRRRGKKVGAVALARRLAGVLWAIWYEGTVFDPERVGAQSEKGLREHAEKTVIVAEHVRRAGRNARVLKDTTLNPQLKSR